MSEHTVFKGINRDLAVVAGVSLVLGALLQWISNAGNFWLGFLAASLLIFLSGILLVLAWRGAGGGKALALMMVLAFLLRVALGVFLAWGLPRYGYEERTQQAGFVFDDAFRREENAWALAQSEDPLTIAFSEDYSTDQYGGMLALSALVYRVISPDAYRPGLISILAVGAMTLSLPFLVVTVRRRFGARTALWAGWILALYPEGVLLGASQMREPFFIFFISMIFWAVAHWLDRSKLKLAIPVFILSTIALFLFSFRIALPVVSAMMLWVWVVEVDGLEKSWQKVLGWIVVAIGGGAILFFFRDWLVEAFHWDTLQTVTQSGVVQFYLGSLPESLQFPFILIYGLFQPVLPAAIAAPAPWIWRSLGIFRALGWYTLMPLMVYAAFRVWKADPALKRRWLIVFLVTISAWVVISSARAGGDQWDNPRYRTIFLPWMAVLSGWGVQFASRQGDRWLARFLIVEGIFLTLFTEWYLSRYYPVIPRPELGMVLIIFLVLSLGVVIGGWWRDRARGASPRKEDE